MVDKINAQRELDAFDTYFGAIQTVLETTASILQQGKTGSSNMMHNQLLNLAAALSSDQGKTSGGQTSGYSSAGGSKYFLAGSFVNPDMGTNTNDIVRMFVKDIVLERIGLKEEGEKVINLMDSIKEVKRTDSKNTVNSIENFIEALDAFRGKTADY